MTKAQDLRSQTPEDLKAQLPKLRKEIFGLRNAVSSKKEDVKPYQIMMKRKDVARILTVLRERELQQNA
jgi:large subunit ribosomal protein L29